MSVKEYAVEDSTNRMSVGQYSGEYWANHMWMKEYSYEDWGNRMSMEEYAVEYWIIGMWLGGICNRDLLY